MNEVHLQYISNGQMRFKTVTSGPAFDALRDAPMFTVWDGWEHSYTKVP